MTVREEIAMLAKERDFLIKELEQDMDEETRMERELELHYFEDRLFELDMATEVCS